MSLLKDVLELTPKAAEVVEKWITDPRESMRGSVAISEAFTLLICSLFVLSFTFILTGLLFFAVAYPEAFTRQAREDTQQKLAALFAVSGSLIFTTFISVIIISVFIATTARLAGATRSNDLLAKIVVVFCLEALIGIPMALGMFSENDTVQLLSLAVMSAVRLGEVILMIVPLKIAGGLRGIRLYIAWLVGVPGPIAVVVLVISLSNWFLLGPQLVQSWD